MILEPRLMSTKSKVVWGGLSLALVVAGIAVLLAR
jgi:hypothetical protein